MNQLTYYDAARNALAQAANIDEVKDVKDKAEAIRLYARQQQDSELEDYAAKIKARAMRRLGQLSSDLDTASNQHALSSGGKTKAEVLYNAGISTTTAHRCEKLASIPEEKFEESLANKANVTSILKQVRTEEIKTEREAIKTRASEVSEKFIIDHGSINSYLTDKRFDFIITDPPYLKEHLDLYNVLGARSAELLNPGGMLIAMCGQSYLDEIYISLSKHLQYYWTACYLTPGQPTPLRQRNVNTTWKPLLCFIRKGDIYKGKIFGDVFKSDGNDKNLHKWGQSESGMYDIISSICLPGQTIFDPFCGAGTTGIAALKHGCLFHGIDIDEENVKISRGRAA